MCDGSQKPGAWNAPHSLSSADHQLDCPFQAAPVVSAFSRWLTLPEKPILVSLRVVLCLYTLRGGEGLADGSGQFHGLPEAILSCLLSVLLSSLLWNVSILHTHTHHHYHHHPNPTLPPSPHTPPRSSSIPPEAASLPLGLSSVGSSFLPSLYPAALASSALLYSVVQWPG